MQKEYNTPRAYTSLANSCIKVKGAALKGVKKRILKRLKIFFYWRAIVTVPNKLCYFKKRVMENVKNEKKCYLLILQTIKGFILFF